MIRNLRTFVVAAETESFSAAGNRLGLTQSAVSTQIRRLEEELGYTLFDRTGKSVTLSSEGRDARGKLEHHGVNHDQEKAEGQNRQREGQNF